MRRLVYNRIPDDGNKGWWRRWLLSYRVLIVEDTDLGADDEAKIVLRERDFRYALLNRSDFHHADLTWADLRGAQLWKSLARGRLNDTQLQGASLKEAEFQGAQMSSAAMQGADLPGSPAPGRRSELHQTSGRHLRGASFRERIEGRPASGRRPARGPTSGRRNCRGRASRRGLDLGRRSGSPVFHRSRRSITAARVGRRQTVGAHTGGEGAVGAGNRYRNHRPRGAAGRDCPASTRSCGVSRQTGRMQRAGRTTPARRRRPDLRTSRGFMPVWLATTAKAISRPA